MENCRFCLEAYGHTRYAERRICQKCVFLRECQRRQAKTLEQKSEFEAQWRTKPLALTELVFEERYGPVFRELKAHFRSKAQLARALHTRV